VGVVTLAHTAPAPFLFEWIEGERAVWHMPRRDPPTVYLTYDDGPNPTTTPDLLDVLGREGVHATFFIIDRHLTEDTAPIVARMFGEGHSVALHSANKSYMLKSAADLAGTLTAAADRIERLAGARPCRAFRPRGGWRSRAMYKGLRQIDYQLVGWGWMLWDVEIFHSRSADRTVSRLGSRVRSGSAPSVGMTRSNRDGPWRTPTRPWAKLQRPRFGFDATPSRPSGHRPDPARPRSASPMARLPL